MAHGRRHSASLTRWPALAALALLVVNDHLLKGSGLLPGWLTGKLSDFAGLFLLPLVLCAALERLAARSSVRWLPWLAAGASALLFSLIKLWPLANGAASRVLGPIWLDPTDLIALPMAFVAAAWLGRGAPPRAPRWLRSLALVASAAGCLATSRPLESRAYPAWTRPTPMSVGCSRLEIWVSKSGKDGIGVTIAARALGPRRECRLSISDAAFDSGPVAVRATRLPEAIDLTESDSYLYLPFEFDNEALWNASVEEGRSCSGSLSISARANGEPLDIPVIRLEQSLAGPHGVPTPAPEAPPPPRPALQMADPAQPLGGSP